MKAKKQRKNLDARIADYVKTVNSGSSKQDYSGYHKPGSNKK